MMASQVMGTVKDTGKASNPLVKEKTVNGLWMEFNFECFTNLTPLTLMTPA